MLLDRKVYIRGIQFLSIILATNANQNFQNKEVIETYYYLLKDLPTAFFLEGINSLVKKIENVHFIPSPKQIRDAVLNEAFCGYNIDEFENLLKVKKATGIIYSDPKLENSLNYYMTDNLMIENIKKNLLN